MKQKLIILFSISLLGVIAYIFWWQELQYTLPTPIPSNYKAITIESKPLIPENQDFSFNKPVFIHFFNPDCPCSRFNLEHIRYLVENYGNKVNFYAILPENNEKDEIENFKLKYDLPIPVRIDKGNALAQAFGVYSTPQAVILDKSQRLYYRGNYNKTRYCTEKKTNFAEHALINLLEGKKPSIYPSLATKSYGCALPIE